MFWAAAGLLLAGGVATLQVLGPPPDVAAPERAIAGGESVASERPAATPGEPGAAPRSGEVASGSAPPESPGSQAAGDAVVPEQPPAAGSAPTALVVPPPIAQPPIVAAGPIPPAPVPAPPAVPPPAAPAPPPLAPMPAREPPGPIAAPDPALLEASRHGAMPRVAADGRTPIRTYARAFPRDDDRPRVGLVVGGIGLSGVLSEEAIRRLPPATALAVSPYAARPEALAARARARGMETLIALPLEPTGFPLNDAGPRALLTTLPTAENADRLLWVLTRLQGYVGAIGALGAMRGERFAQLPEQLRELQEVLRDRGLLYVDPRPNLPPGTPMRAFGRTVDVVIDDPATRGEIERRLAELERLARERGSALGLAGDATPVLVERVAAWAAGLEERGLAFAPITALIRRPETTRPESAGR